MFLTPEDFTTLPFVIANLDENGETLQTVINRVEKDYLIKVLGLRTYNEFLLGLEALPVVWNVATDYILDDEVYQGVTVWRALQPNVASVPVEGADWTKVRDDFWLKLRDGYGYELLEKSYMYEGIDSFLIPLVVYFWVKDFVFDTQTDGGIVVSETENASQNGVRDRMSRAWNFASDTIGCNSAGRNTLWGFLYENQDADELADLNFQPLYKVNVFDF